ncbi:MAG: hypothetical protein WDN01_10465 [Rhizomicrobium sp.]
MISIKALPPDLREMARSKGDTVDRHSPTDRLEAALKGPLSFLRSHLRFVAAGILIVVLAGVGWLAGWFGRSQPSDILVLSGDIEAHESVLSFKTIQSRITLLPFDEGETVRAGTILARVDDADYRQQIVMAQAALDVQKRQLAAAQQSVGAAQQTILNDAADLSEKQIDAGRELALWAKKATSEQARDLARTAAKQSAAALARDQALARVAERNVDLAAANVSSAEAALEMPTCSAFRAICARSARRGCSKRPT